jgi:hypothetical protein
MAGTVPSTGPLSATTLNTIGERAGTANAPLGVQAGTAGAGSLTKLYGSPNSNVNQSAPYAYSEFRGKTFSSIVQITARIQFGNSPNGACTLSGGSAGTFYKNNGQPISYGDIMYTDLAGTTFAASGTYAYGTLTYPISGTYNEIFCVGSSGVITSLAPGNGNCPGGCP